MEENELRLGLKEFVIYLFAKDLGMNLKELTPEKFHDLQENLKLNGVMPGDEYSLSELLVYQTDEEIDKEKREVENFLRQFIPYTN